MSEWAWAPIPLVLVAMALIRAADPPAAVEPPYLLGVLNFVFSTSVMVFVSYLASRSFRRRPRLSVLLLGCGTLTFGIASVVAAVAIHYEQLDIGLTTYNTGMLIAGLCHLFAAAGFGAVSRHPRHPTAVVVGAYGFILMAMGLLTFAAWEGLTPTFFIPGVGGTPLRQGVLVSAIGSFVLAAVLLALRSSRGGTFTRWYAYGLGLIAVGLLGVLFASHVGSPLGWLGRGAQYLGGVYILVATILALRDSGHWELALQQALWESEERFHFAAWAAGLGPYSRDLQTGEDEWSPELLAIYGFAPDEPFPLDDGIPAVVHPDDRARVRAEAQARQQHADEPDFSSEHRIVRPDGEVRWVLLRGRTLFDADGKPLKTVGFAMDITDRKRAEEDLRELNATLEQRVAERTAELEQRADQLSHLASELTLAEQRERRRLAQVLHDHLQQLLVATKFSLETASRRANPAVEQDLGETEALIDEAIGASRSLTVELSPPILHDAGLRPALEWLARWMAEKHGLHVDLEADPEAGTDREDVRVLLFQAVRELLFNIVKHTDVTRARVEVGVHHGPDDAKTKNLRVTVADDGHGFDPETALQDKTRAGFGLFSIQERLALLGGTLAVDSRPSEGATFTLIAPMDGTAPADEDQPSTSHVPDKARPVVTPPADTAEQDAVATDGPIRLLLVDDHDVMRRGLCFMLEDEDDAFEVVGEAANGVEALEQARRLQPDVVLMDFSMPAMNGVEATRRLRSEMPHIQVIGLSMYEEPDRAAAMTDAGAAAYLSKSGSADVLLDTIRSVHALHTSGN
ncbi:MAG: response regulator [Planctomycetota bacterium]